MVLDQASVEEAPDFTLLGVAVSVTIGALPETVTVADCVADPPAPVQVIWYLVVLQRPGVCQTAFRSTLPCQGPAVLVTVAAQAVASVDFQVRVDLPPVLMVVGAALNVSVGARGEVAASAVLLALAASELSAANVSIDLNANGSRWP